jgi:hypothetical protein
MSEPSPALAVLLSHYADAEVSLDAGIVLLPWCPPVNELRAGGSAGFPSLGHIALAGQTTVLRAAGW